MGSKGVASKLYWQNKDTTLVNLFIAMLALYVHLRTEKYFSLVKQAPKFTAEMGELNFHSGTSPPGAQI